MSNQTSNRMREKGHTARWAARRGEDSASVARGANRGRLAPSAVAAWRAPSDAAVAANAQRRARCHELRINDANTTSRLIYRVDPDAIVIVEVFAKKTQKTPKELIQACKRRLKEYDDA